jgi:hypothetical protein
VAWLLLVVPAMRSTLLPATGLAVLLTACLPARSLAQDATRSVGPPCDGLRVTRIDIRPGRPPFEGTVSRWRHAARALGLHHTTTRRGVIDAFLALEVGGTCTEQRRAESERLVRDQPFIADALVRSEPDGRGGVVMVVETVDEVPVLVGGQARGLNLQSFSLGNSNVGGLGLLAQGYLERGYQYRPGYGLRLIEYAAFGRPYVATLEGFRHPLGFYRNVELAHPFYTDLQRVAWHGAFSDEEEYRGVARPAHDPLALRVKLQRWDATGIARAFGTRTVTLLGVGASGLDLTPATEGIVVADSGLAADTGTTLRGRYRPFRTVRLGVLGGIRRIGFRTVRGFDGLASQQDVAKGVMTGLYAAHGVGRAEENDLFLSGGVYAGQGNARLFVATVAQMEARRDPALERWDSMIGSGRAALYFVPSRGMLVLLEDRYSTGMDSRLPLQLDLGDHRGGILGYRSASLAGARRNAARIELRASRTALVRNADLGIGTFGEVGSIWAGDAPYGRTATRSTVGFSLLAAYPTRSKRLYRADVGIPLRRGGEGGGKIEVRFSSEDRSSLFWREPHDIERARTGPVPSTLFVVPQAR